MHSSAFTSHASVNLSEIEIERRYRLLIDAVHDYAIFMLDPSGNVTSWNPGAQRAKGYAPAEIVGRHFSVFYTREDIATGKPAQLLAAAALHGRVEDEGWRVRKDGSRFWANVVITAVPDQNGALLGFAKITRDLSERRRLEELERAAAASALVHQAREHEQKRIARELHDDLGQQVAALKMALALHETELVQHVPQETRERLYSIRELANQIDAMAMSVRRVAADLRERILQLGGVLSIESAPGDGVTVTAKVPLSRIMVES